MRFDLSDEEWALLEPLLPKSRKSARVDDRKIVNAIFYVLRTGMPWRDLPARYAHTRRCVCRKLDSAILVMKPSENRSGCNDADAVNNPVNGSIHV